MPMPGQYWMPIHKQFRNGMLMPGSTGTLPHSEAGVKLILLSWLSRLRYKLQTLVKRQHKVFRPTPMILAHCLQEYAVPSR